MLLEQQLAKSLGNALQLGFTSTFSLDLKGKEISVLRDLAEQNKSKLYKKTPLMNNFDKICKIVATNSPECSGDVFQAALNLTYDVLILREEDRKLSHYVHSSEHRDGLEVQDFLFDLINEAAGYTEKYYDEHFEHTN